MGRELEVLLDHVWYSIQRPHVSLKTKNINVQFFSHENIIISCCFSLDCEWMQPGWTRHRKYWMFFFLSKFNFFLALVNQHLHELPAVRAALLFAASLTRIQLVFSSVLEGRPVLSTVTAVSFLHNYLVPGFTAMFDGSKYFFNLLLIIIFYDDFWADYSISC